MNPLLRFARRSAALVLLLPLCACALANIASEPAPQLFTLSAGHPAPSTANAAGRARVVVDEFAAPAVVDSARIVQRSGANELKYYADARWADRAPRLIQNLMVETMENSGRFAAVATRSADLRGDYELAGDIRQFAVDATDASSPAVRIELYARLVLENERSIVAAKSFSASVPVKGGGISAIVAAYDAGLRQVLEGIAIWADESARTAAAKTAQR
ncbi:ABC-type transport auxiliary lipoprotein family protein [Parvibaculum sp.]|uniref:ABC-type transport auxiliary lipoprotein family protein n=1 Tax=Parvibaculum sp. TaxID=2024848 RepID=UPI00320DE230